MRFINTDISDEVRQSRIIKQIAKAKLKGYFFEEGFKDGILAEKALRFEALNDFYSRHQKSSPQYKGYVKGLAARRKIEGYYE